MDPKFVYCNFLSIIPLIKKRRTCGVRVSVTNSLNRANIADQIVMEKESRVGE